jgi:hypothetical protein
MLLASFLPPKEDHPPMVAWNMGRPWADQSRAHARTATKPVIGELLRESALAFRIRTATRTAWVPKSLTEHDAARGTFTMPQWLATQKLLD